MTGRGRHAAPRAVPGPRGERRGARLFGRALAAVAVLAAVTAVAAGGLTVVTTSGTSMNPTFREGDLVVVVAAESYAAGQVVAYRDHVHDLVVMHRIVSGDASGYVLQGDHNDSVDAVQPAKTDLIGRAALRVPGGGAVLRRLLGPLPLSVIALATLVAGGTVRRRRRRRRPMTRAAPRTPRAPYAATSPRLRACAGVTAATGLVALALTVLAWTTPVGVPAPVATAAASSMTFSYDAAVGRTAAYDATTVRSPDPVFRAVAGTVDVRLGYDGEPATVSVDAELSTVSGWRSTVPLSVAASFIGGRYDGTVRLDLTALDQRARAAAAVTGLPANEVTVAIRPRVTRTDGTTFTSSLRLTLTPSRLALTDGPASLTVTDVPPTRAGSQAPRMLRLLGRAVPVTTARTAAPAVLLLALLAAAALLAATRRAAPTDETVAIHRRYASLLLPVHPMPAAHAVVDVTAFAALARLADRYGLLVLHWTRSGVTTFVVQDQGTTYRYRAGTAAAATLPELSPAPTTEGSP